MLFIGQKALSYKDQFALKKKHKKQKNPWTFWVFY